MKMSNVDSEKKTATEQRLCMNMNDYDWRFARQSRVTNSNRVSNVKNKASYIAKVYDHTQYESCKQARKQVREQWNDRMLYIHSGSRIRQKRPPNISLVFLPKVQQKTEQIAMYIRGKYKYIDNNVKQQQSQ